MSAKSLAALWQDTMRNGDAFLDAEGQIQGWKLDGLVAINDAQSGGALSSAMKGYRWIVYNSMRAYGEADPNKLIVRINVAKHKRNRESLIDTLVHEELNILFPRLREARICAMTERKLRRLSKRAKAKRYARVRSRPRDHSGTARGVRG